MQKIIQVLLVSTFIAGHYSQKIVIDNSTLISPCNTGARSVEDSYNVTGTIGDNITLALNQNWEIIVFIKMLRRTSPQLKTICQLVMGTRTCSSISTIKCKCVYNTTTDQAHFTVSDTVQAVDSNAIIYVQWDHPNGPSIYSNKNYTFPEIYDVNAAQLSLTVAGVTGNLPSGSCSFTLTLNKSNDLELCCSNTATPCYPQISFNRNVTANNVKKCVTYQTSQLTSDVVTGILDLSYSVCTNTSYIRGNNCSVISKPATDVTTATTESASSSSNADDGSALTTESSSSSSHTTDASTTTTELSSSSPLTTAPPEPDPVCNTTCIAVIVSVVVVIIIIGVAVAIYCWKTKKRPKGVSNQGTNGNGDQAHTGEHHKKDGHNAEHRNQAYDGRRSSPSEVTIDDVKTTKYENIQQHNKAHEKDSNKPISDRTNDDNASQSVPGNPRQLPPIKGTHTHGQLHPPAGSRPASVETTSATAVKL